MRSLELAHRGCRGRCEDLPTIGHLPALPVLRARYTMMCHENGGVLDDLVVYRLADDRSLVVANAASTAVMFALLRDRARGLTGG